VSDAELPARGGALPEKPLVIARVALDMPMERLFDYLAPDADADDIGRRVEAPFGNRILIGVLLELTTCSEVAPERLRGLHAIDRDSPPLPADLLALARFVSGYYHHALGAVLAMLLPPALRRAASGGGTRKPPLAAAYRLTQTGREPIGRIPERYTARKMLADKLLAGELPAWI
jgi:primosomal protein N' (replication factor Y) (superfamily II helicase)